MADPTALAAQAAAMTADQITELEALVAQVEAGDLSKLPALRKAFTEWPHVWQVNGDVANQGVLAWVEVLAGGSEVRRECVRRKMGALWRELAGDNAGPLERLLLDRVIVNWLAVWHADTVYAQQMDRLDRKWALFCLERTDRAQRRYLASLKALAQVRRLLVPAQSTDTTTTKEHTP